MIYIIFLLLNKQTNNVRLIFQCVLIENTPSEMMNVGGLKGIWSDVVYSLKVPLDLIFIIEIIRSLLLFIELRSYFRLNELDRRNLIIEVDVVSFSLHVVCVIEWKYIRSKWHNSSRLFIWSVCRRTLLCKWLKRNRFGTYKSCSGYW